MPDHTNPPDFLKPYFANALANQVMERNLIHLPECAGIWWLDL